jgi:formylglycine-generating enzyme required for sulfatase activity
MAEGRSALIIAVSQYQDTGLRQLVAPAQDAEALARVLEDPAIGGFKVAILSNQPSHQVNREIEAFFANRHREDLLLLYFSGHGIKDEEGRLYFATTDTDRKFLRTTAVAAALINDVMHHSRSRRQVLILDCCYSGAFARGMTMVKADTTVDAGEYFREGRGQFVLTASDALQYAFEGDEIKGEGVCSVFTNTLVRGLETGEADLDGDGKISCDELYDYLHDRVTDRMPQQKPRKWAFAVEGEIIIARNPHPVVKPTALPAELQQSIENPLPGVREGAARHLRDLLQHSNKRLAVAAHAALLRLAEDDSQKVQAVVAEILKAHADERPLVTEKEPVTTLPKKAKTQSTLSEPATPIPKLRGGAFRLLVMLVLGILGGTGLYHFGREWFEPAPIPTPLTAPPPAQERPATAAPESTKPTSAAVSIIGGDWVAKPSSPPAIQNIHGWSAQQVQDLQKQTAQVLKLNVEFQDPLNDGSQGPLMVVIPAGHFLMGSPEGELERGDDERQHEVEVAAFAISKYEVTFADYDRFADTTGRKNLPSDERWDRGRRPVINVRWYDVIAYAEWLSQQTGRTYRLPTEAEWEYAARAGTTTPFYFGATISTDQANYDGNYVYGKGRKGVYREKTVEVGQFPANAWGLHDMSGNVWEWTCSVYNENYDERKSEERCAESDTGDRCVMRGGAWLGGPRNLRGAARFSRFLNFKGRDIGFRLARTL